MELGCGQTRSFVTPGIGFGGLAYRGYAGSVGFSIGPGGCPRRKIVTDFPLPRVLGLELRIQGAAKATSTHSARKSIGPSKVVVSLPPLREILAGWGLEAYA